MAVRVADKIKQLNDGSFPLMDAVDVDMGNGVRLSDMKGSNNGFAELDSDGKVPISQLPSYVDDVVEYTSVSDFPEVGESGKIYVDITENKTYRWGGTEYVAIASDLALGETSSTAYRGDRGKAAYDHANDANKSVSKVQGLYKMAVSQEGHPSQVVAVTKQDILDLGVPDIDDTSTSTDKTWSANKIGSELDDKVDKITGKQLSTEDYTTAEKTKLSGIEDNANNYTLPTASTSTLGGVKVDGTSITADENGVISANATGLTQYTSMPTPSASYVGKVVQYIGTNATTYKPYHFYKGMLTHTEFVVDYYTWEHRGDGGGGGYSHSDIYTKTLTPSKTADIFSNKACTTVISGETFSRLVENGYGQGVNRLDIYNSGMGMNYYMGYNASKSSTHYEYTYEWIEVSPTDEVINDATSSSTTTYSSNKLDTSLASKLNANMTWEGTHAEYEAVKDTIPVGATVIFTDDDQGVTYLDEQYDVLNNAYDIVHNNSNNSLAGANAVKAMTTYSTSETIIGTWIDGKPIYRKVVDFGALPNASSKTVSANIPNLDKIIKMDAMRHRASDNGSSSLPSLTFNITNLNLSVSIFSAEDDITIVTFSDRSNETATVIIEYTKTTD